jgi:hypothetical protein
VLFRSRVKKEWLKLNDQYVQHPDVKASDFDEEMVRIAEKFKARHKWTLYGESVKNMAYEPDDVETNESGEPLTAAVDYDIFYFWTSHYVHATCSGLDGHIGKKGEPFRIRGVPSREERFGRLALINVISNLAKISIQVCRTIREEQPERIIRNMMAMDPSS